METLASHSLGSLELLWTQVTNEGGKFSISYLMICRGVPSTFGKASRMLNAD